MSVQMTHPRYGTRTVFDEQVPSYLNTGWTEGSEVAPELVAGNRDQVLADVGDDPDRARAALAAEQSRPNPRTTLVAALTRIADTADTTSEV